MSVFVWLYVSGKFINVHWSFHIQPVSLYRRFPVTTVTAAIVPISTSNAPSLGIQ